MVSLLAFLGTYWSDSDLDPPTNWKSIHWLIGPQPKAPEYLESCWKMKDKTYLTGVVGWRFCLKYSKTSNFLITFVKFCGSGELKIDSPRYAPAWNYGLDRLEEIVMTSLTRDTLDTRVQSLWRFSKFLIVQKLCSCLTFTKNSPSYCHSLSNQCYKSQPWESNTESSYTLSKKKGHGRLEPWFIYCLNIYWGPTVLHMFLHITGATAHVCWREIEMYIGSYNFLDIRHNNVHREQWVRVGGSTCMHRCFSTCACVCCTGCQW